MDDRLHIAKTEKEYMEGLKNPSKNIMYFPNANQMTMNGMKTPIKYYGITNGKITDEGYAKPGQKFNVNGVSTLEVRAPQMQLGGRMRYQTSGNPTPTPSVDPEQQRLNTLVQRLIYDINNGNPNNRGAAIKNFSDQLRTFHPSDVQGLGKDIIQMFGPNSAVKDEILKAGNFDANGDYNPNIQKDYTPHSDYDNRFLRDKDARVSDDSYGDLFNLKENSDLYSTTIDNNGFPVKGETVPAQYLWDLEKIGGGRSMYVPDNEYAKEHINQFDYDDPTKIRSFNIQNNNNPFGDEFTKYPDWFDKSDEDVNTPTQPVTTPVTNQPVQTTPVTTPAVTTPQGIIDPGKVYPGYKMPANTFGQGNKYKSVQEMQGRMREFLDENKNFTYNLAGPNRGVDNTYGSTTHGFLNDPKMMQAFTEWESKKYPTQTTVTPTANTTTTPTANPNDRPFGTRTLNYTDNNWYMTPGGSKYRTSTQSGSGSGMNFQLPDGTVVNSTSIPPELIQQAKDNPISIPTQSPSSRFRDKANDAYGRLEEGFNSFKDRMNMDRSDRAMMKHFNYLAKAEEAAGISNDRQSKKLLRKSQKQFERIAPLQAIQNANEARKDAEAITDLARMKKNLGVKQNRAVERQKTSEAEAKRTPEYYQTMMANKQYNQSANAGRDRERDEAYYNRAREDAKHDITRDIIRDDSRDLRLDINLQNRDGRNKENEQYRTDYIQGYYDNKDKKAVEKKQQGGYIPKAQYSAQFDPNDPTAYFDDVIHRTDYKHSIVPYKNGSEYLKAQDQKMLDNRDKLPNTSAPFTQGRPVTSPFDEPYQKHEFQLKDYSKESPSSMVGRNNPNSGIPYHGQNLYGTHDPSFSLNYSEGRMPNMGVSNNFQDAVNKPLTFDPNKPVLNDSSITGVPNPKSDSTVTGSKGTGKYTFTPGEWTQFAGTMMPAFYNLAQSMRKPHKFKEFQNPYDGRYLSNLASHLPYDDSRIVAAQNRVMKSAQQQAPNFQTAQAYQMAGMSGLNREQKDYQMKNEMANQEYASKYNQAAHNVNAAQQAIKAGAHEATRLAQAALNQLQHKAVTQMGMGIHDLGKLMVNREMNKMEMSLMGQIYQQYGLAPIEAVLNGQASWDDIVLYKKDPAAMAKFLQGVDKAHAQNAQNRQQQTTTNSDNGINTEVTTTTAGGYGRSGAGNGLGSLQRGGRVFNLKGINNINKYR